MRTQPDKLVAKTVTLAIAAVLIAASAVADMQLISPITQSRMVAGMATATSDFYYQVADDEESALAFDAFDTTVAVDAEVFGATASSSAWQQSTIGTNRLDATGGEMGSSEGYDANGWGDSNDRSTFDVTFDVAVAARARLVGTLNASAGASGQAVLTGPQEVIVSSALLNPGETTSFDEQIFLVAGEHRLLVEVIGTTLGDMESPDQSAADYNVSLRLCPAADLDGSGIVDLADLHQLLAFYGQQTTIDNGELNGDGQVTLDDLVILLASYGTVCTLN